MNYIAAIALSVVTCVPMVAQSPSKKVSSAADGTGTITIEVDKINRQAELRNQMDDEFMDMAMELSHLYDPKVAAIMDPHITRIKQIVTEMEKLGDPYKFSPPDKKK